MASAIELADFYLSEALRLADAAKVSEEPTGPSGCGHGWLTRGRIPSC